MSENISVLYYNARSLLPKYDELVGIHNPDVVCIAESWLCSDINDREIDIPSYTLIRLDRNRHGGGVLMYIKDNVQYKPVLSHPHNLELFFISLTLQSMKDSIFYRPPSSPACLWDSLFNIIGKVNPNLYSNFIIIGDFNANLLVSSPVTNSVLNLMNSFQMSQVVHGATHYGHQDSSTSLIDLVIMSVPESVLECETVPPLGNSDHAGISLKLNRKIVVQQKQSNSRVIWR